MIVEENTLVKSKKFTSWSKDIGGFKRFIIGKGDIKLLMTLSFVYVLLGVASMAFSPTTESVRADVWCPSKSVQVHHECTPPQIEGQMGRQNEAVNSGCDCCLEYEGRRFSADVFGAVWNGPDQSQACGFRVRSGSKSWLQDGRCGFFIIPRLQKIWIEEETLCVDSSQGTFALETESLESRDVDPLVRLYVRATSWVGLVFAAPCLLLWMVIIVVSRRHTGGSPDNPDALTSTSKDMQDTDPTLKNSVDHS